MARAAPILQRKPAARSAPVQAKLNVGPVGDRFEQEADRVASRIGSSSTRGRAPADDIGPVGAARRRAARARGRRSRTRTSPPPEKRAQRKAKAAPKERGQEIARAPSARQSRGPEERTKRPARAAQRKAARKNRTTGGRQKAARTEDGRAGRAHDRTGRRARRRSAGGRRCLDPADAKAPRAGARSDHARARGERRRLGPRRRARAYRCGRRGCGERARRARLHGRAGHVLRPGPVRHAVDRRPAPDRARSRPYGAAGRRLGRGAARAARPAARASGAATARPKRECGHAVQPDRATRQGRWAVDLDAVGSYQGTIEVPKLELPKIAGSPEGDRP